MLNILTTLFPVAWLFKPSLAVIPIVAILMLIASSSDRTRNQAIARIADRIASQQTINNAK